MSDNSILNQTLSRMLDPASMGPLVIEKDTVFASEVFHSERTWRALQEYTRDFKVLEASGDPLPESVQKINRMIIADGEVPQELSHPDLSAEQTAAQAKMIYNAPFLKAVASHPDYRVLPGFEIQRKIVNETELFTYLWQRAVDLFKRNKIYTVRGSYYEAKFAERCYGMIWPIGIDLYAILREMYPAFHARTSVQIPLWMAENILELLDAPVQAKDIKGIGGQAVDAKGRLHGLYTVAEIPEKQVTPKSLFLEQAHLGRRAIVLRVLKDAIAVVDDNGGQNILVIDYAGGVGNCAELLLKQIYDLPDGEIKSRLINNLRVAVVDIAVEQLAVGRARFACMNQLPELHGISEKVVFFHADVTQSLSEQFNEELRMVFGDAFIQRPLYLGMTAYTAGALDNAVTEEGITIAAAMADEMYRQCWKIYAVDFSAPSWRMEGFLRDTGKWGREFLRAVYGISEPEDRTTPLKRILAFGLKLRYGLSFFSVADFIKFMALAPIAASGYTMIWPDSDGHNSGYTVMEDGTLKKPSILSFGIRLKQRGALVFYKSQVFISGTLDLGRVKSGKRAWAIVPGWVGDFVVAENEANRI